MLKDHYITLILYQNKVVQAVRARGGGLGDTVPPDFFAKVDLLPIGNDSEKKKLAKK